MKSQELARPTLKKVYLYTIKTAFTFSDCGLAAGAVKE